MKIEDVPQDLKYYRGSVVRDVNYAVDADGRYQVVMSDGWQPKNDALELALDDIDAQCRDLLQQVRRGECSLLAYHATKNLMDVDLLAAYTGFSRRTVRKHFQPRYFDRLDETTLRRYADVLRISVEQLTSVPADTPQHP